MTREIKFRAWDKAQKRWHSDWSSLFPWGTHQNDKEKIILDIMPNHFVFCQFTGLLDKQGKEIYEGDIVKIDGDIHEIAWEIGCFWYGPHEFSYFPEQKAEVIGNIYTNPELLKT